MGSLNSSDGRKSKYTADSELACRHRPGRNGFLVQGPPKEPGVASLASKRVHENYLRQDMLQDSLFPGTVNQQAFTIRTTNAHVHSPLRRRHV